MPQPKFVHPLDENNMGFVELEERLRISGDVSTPAIPSKRFVAENSGKVSRRKAMTRIMATKPGRQKVTTINLRGPRD